MNDDSTFLNELQSNNFIFIDEKLEKEKEKELKNQNSTIEKKTKQDEKIFIKNAKEIEKMNKLQEKEIIKINKKNDIENNENTEIQGKNCLLLNKKISQFIILFPDQLKNFKYKQNSSEEELQVILDECSLLVEVGSIDIFIMNSIVSAIQLGENFSKLTDYDLSGLSIMLKQNKEFVTLCKILSIKYSIFSNVPAEIQMILLISCTAFLCIDKNNKSKNIESYLMKLYKKS